MPVFQYKCPKCGETFKLKRELYENDSKIKCPKCKTLHPERIRKTLLDKFLYGFEGRESTCGNCSSSFG